MQEPEDSGSESDGPSAVSLEVFRAIASWFVGDGVAVAAGLGVFVGASAVSVAVGAVMSVGEGGIGVAVGGIAVFVLRLSVVK